MKMKLDVRVSERTGQAFVCVPASAMWELVEYLALHRTHVHYGYTEVGFTVTFLHLGKEAAQELLNGWNESWMNDPAYEHPEARAEGRRGLFSLAV